MADRELLLDAAERVIRRDGAGASLDAIAVAAGVTKPVVYARVGSRAALSDALAARLAQRVFAAAQREVAGGGIDRATLAGFFTATLQTLADHRELFAYVTRGGTDDTAQRNLYLAGESAGPLAAFLAHRRVAMGADTAVATPWAYGIIGMLNLTATWWLEQGTSSAAVLGDQLAELVWAGMRGDG